MSSVTAASVTRASVAGARTSCSKPQDSAEAVVSCPATSSVTSSSRSSRSVIGCPASSRAASSIVITSSPSSPVRAALLDQREDERVGAVAHLDEALPGGQPAEVAAEQRQQRERRRAEVEQLLERGAQLVELRPGGHAEHGAQDHLERQRLRALVQPERRAGAPAGDLRRGDLLHHAGEGAHALAVEGGQHQLALGEVLGAVEQQHGARADDRLEHARALARVQDVGGRGEHLADLVGLREEDPLALGRADVDREAIAVARAALLHERHGPQGPAEQVERHRPRTRREAHTADRTGRAATLPRL